MVPEPTSQVEAAREDGGCAAGDQRVPSERQHPGPHGGNLAGATGGPLAGTATAERAAGVPGASADRLPQLPHATAHRALHRTAQAADTVPRHVAGPSVLLHRRPQAQGQGARRVHHQGTADGVNRLHFLNTNNQFQICSIRNYSSLSCSTNRILNVNLSLMYICIFLNVIDKCLVIFAHSSLCFVLESNYR